MRFMYDYNHILEIETIEDVDASPCWDTRCKGRENNPDHFIVTIYRTGWHIASEEKREYLEIMGEYILDGTEETYFKAVKNYNSICMKLLEKGYCKASDFENFDWD